jgi:adenylate cyclase
VIAAIDEKSLEAEGRWPWPRPRIAALIDALSADGAKVIGFDVLFSEPIRSRTAAEEDGILVQALAHSSASVVLGYFFHMTESSGYRLEPGDIARRLDAIASSRYPLLYKEGASEEPVFVRAYAPQGNLPAFAAAAASSGYFSVASDADGVVRWMPLAVQSGDDVFPPLALLCAWHYLGKPSLSVHTGRYSVLGVELGERFIPTDEDGQLFINYRGPPGTFATYSIADILNGKLPPGTFKEKIVIVGATALGIGDIRTTPFGPLYPGPEIHASAVDNLLAGDFIARPRWSRIFDLFSIVGLSLLVGLALRRSSALVGLLVAAGLLVFFVASAYWLFVASRVWLNMVYPVFALASTYTALTVYRYVVEERERRRLKAAFQHYVAPDVIELMLKDPGGVRLGGHDAVVTALISDLEGFTTFSENRAPNEIISVLGDYYAEMTEQVFAQQGTLVEYVGDEIFALFGAPVAQPDHAKRACASALAMREHRIALSEAWTQSGRPRLRARTGITTGTMLVGNIGSKYRFHYGAIGDAVNLASRLEGLNKVYGTEIIISDHTAQAVADSFTLRELDLVRVKGRQQTLRVHELLGVAGLSIPGEQKEMLSLYASALALYRQRRWDDALELFRQCLVLWPEDGPSLTLERRCVTFRENPPPADWAGTFEQLTK